MSIFKDIEVVTCPKCKGHGRFLGQKKKDSYGHIENYKHIESGECFLCRGRGKALYNGEYIFGFNKEGDTFLGWDKSAKYKKSLGRATRKDMRKYDNIIEKGVDKDDVDEAIDNVMKEIYFPSRYELVFDEGSKMLDDIFIHPFFKPVIVKEMYLEEDGCALGFIIYFNDKGNPLKIGYVHSNELGEDSSLNLKGVVSVPDKYLGVSGTYYIDSDKVMIGITNEKGLFKQFSTKCDKNLLDSYDDVKILWDGFGNNKCIAKILDIVYDMTNVPTDEISV